MNDRNCQECSKELPSWAGFCPFCGAKYRATTVLKPVDADGPIRTQMLFLGTTEAGFVESNDGPEKPQRAGEAEPAARTMATPTAEVAIVNREALALFESEPALHERFEDRFEEHDDFDFDGLDGAGLRSRSQKLLVTVATLLTIGAFGYGAFLLATTSEEPGSTVGAADIAMQAKAPAVDIPAQLPELPRLQPFQIATAGKTASVRYGDEEILEITTAKGSRYDNVEQRAKSVIVRLEHIAQKQRESRDMDARFVARVNGDRYEVVWDDGSPHPFRATDITRHDIEKGGDVAIEANLRADALTDFFRRSIAPVALPTS